MRRYNPADPNAPAYPLNPAALGKLVKLGQDAGRYLPQRIIVGLVQPLVVHNDFHHRENLYRPTPGIPQFVKDQFAQLAAGEILEPMASLAVVCCHAAPMGSDLVAFSESSSALLPGTIMRASRFSAVTGN